MLGKRRKSGAHGGAFRFRVSDVVDVPLRGTVLRLRLVEGAPSIGDLGVGARLQLEGPRGGGREVRITGHPLTGGNQTQERLERTRELDVLVDDGSAGGIEIGWVASGPVD